MTLRGKLLSIIVVPVAVLLLVTAVEVVRQARSLSALGATGRSVELATGLGALVHELQKERGMSAGFIASRGKQFAAELPRQREATDASAAVLERILASAEVVPEEARKALATAGERSTTRQGIDAGALEARLSFAFYTAAIDALLAAADGVARGASDTELLRRSGAYLSLLRAKEFAGRERATLNAVFAKDAFDAESYRRYLAVLSAQEVHLAAFQGQARPEARAAWEEAVGADRHREVADLRALALQRFDQGGFQVEPRRWFAASTARIEAMKGVEDRLAADLLALVADGRAAAWRQLAASLALLVVGLGVALAVALRRVRAIVAQLGGEPEAVSEMARAMAAGDLTRDTGAPAPEGSVLQATQLMVARLREVLGEVRASLDGLASGDLPPPVEIPFPGDLDAMRVSLNACIATLRGLERDTVALVEAAVEGRLEVRADAARHGGAYRRIVEGINGTIGTLVGHLDAIPAPAMIVDRERRVRYLNAAGRALVGKGALEVVGQGCADLFRTGNCDEERCVCLAAMRSGRTESGEAPARPGGAAVELRHAGVPLRDGAGRIAGAFEVFADQTDVKRAAARAGKVAGYQAAEADRIVAALEGFAHGDFSRQVEVAAADADTAEVGATYRKIGAAIAASAAAVRRLVADMGSLAEAGVAGKLSVRVAAGAHEGDFRAVAEGVNRTLDAALAPVDEATRILERLARRDLTARMAGAYEGDHARIKSALNETAEALHEALRQVREAAAQVSDAATQIASSSQEVATGASTQAGSIQQTGGSLEQVARTSGATAEHAAQACLLAGAATGAARKGSEAVERAQATMARMRASAEGTAEIIKDINGIAFQTNLLALNAAVEAARAGDAGRGFAVVADEVRSLARRSKEAAARTEALIHDSVRQSEEGEVVTRELAARFGEIVGGVERVTAIVKEISASAREEAAGIERVSSSVGDMDRVTQQNAASAEQSSSAAAQLSAQAEELASMVSSFTIAVAEAGRRA